jgi:hypothetical protein
MPSAQFLETAARASLRRRYVGGVTGGYVGGVTGECGDQKRLAVTLMARARMMALKKKPTTP